MAHLWVQDKKSWAVTQLGSETLALSSPDRVLADQCPKAKDPKVKARGSKAKGGVHLFCRRGRNGDIWTLMAAATACVSINGEALQFGIRVLKDRDSIRVGSDPIRFFCTERLAKVENCDAGAAPLTCPRCRQPIAEGTSIVKCPQCGVAHHQTPELPCWTGYADSPFAACALGDHPATLEGEFRWTPNDL